jgi:Coenzyme PQQ synthesis protein D (PqqD)
MDNFPRARRHKLVIQEVADELLIYDQDRDKAHCLNQSAALIWRCCDGNTSVLEISRKLSRYSNGNAAERMVWHALNQLSCAQLLEEPLTPPAAIQLGMNRRQAVRALGLAAFVAVPLVTSIVAPTPAQAATCIPSGGMCTGSAQCCSGLCSAGTCA